MAKDISDRVVHAGGLAFIAGLVTWYAGASDAIDRALTVSRFFVVACALGFVAGLVALIARGSVRKRVVGDAVFLAAGIAFITFNSAALCNRYADTSTRRSEVGAVVSFATPTKGPRTIRIALAEQPIVLSASNASGCEIGDQANVDLRSGALGTRWIQEVHCDVTTPRHR